MGMQNYIALTQTHTLTVENVHHNDGLCVVAQFTRVVARIVSVGVRNVQSADCAVRMQVRFDAALSI